MVRNRTETIRIAYSISKRVSCGELTQAEGKRSIANLTERGENTVAHYIPVFLAMMNGKVYKRTLCQEGTRYYFENILQDFGSRSLEKALDAARQHAQYHVQIGWGRLPYVEQLIDEFEQKHLG